MPVFLPVIGATLAIDYSINNDRSYDKPSATRPANACIFCHHIFSARMISLVAGYNRTTIMKRTSSATDISIHGSQVNPITVAAVLLSGFWRCFLAA
jgi:hypothetical protein